jgi:PhzF family phenazine biosynthesis protein
MHRRYFEIDVFGRTPLRGNPLAVVLDAEGLSPAEMQAFAAWTNFSETTFVLAPTEPTADYAVRIFTITTELPFAGHPTLGTARAWLAAGGRPKQEGRVIQSCGVGLVTIRVEEPRLAFAGPSLVRSGPIDPPLLREVIDGLGLTPDGVLEAAWVDNGPGWIGVLVDSMATLSSIRPNMLEHPVGVVALGGMDDPTAYEVRGFFPEGSHVIEDPVTGSLHASLAQWLMSRGRVTAPFCAAQGRFVGRDGLVQISTEQDQIWVGGSTTVVIDGSVDL